MATSVVESCNLARLCKNTRKHIDYHRKLAVVSSVRQFMIRHNNDWITRLFRLKKYDPDSEADFKKFHSLWKDDNWIPIIFERTFCDTLYESAKNTALKYERIIDSRLVNSPVSIDNDELNELLYHSNWWEWTDKNWSNRPWVERLADLV